MHTWILMAALASGSPSEPIDGLSFESLETAVECLADAVPTGTLLVTEGDCLAVRIYTQSPFTHVAAVVRRHGQPVVYDSANGVGVRCQTLRAYLTSQGPRHVHVLFPKADFSDDQTARFERWLDGQLGRPYSVAHHLTGDRCDGLHCSEYVTEALINCGLMKAENPARVSPASLVEGVTKHQVYESVQSIEILPAPEPVEATPTSWYGRAWACTKSCTSSWCRRTRAWILCR